MFGSQRTDSVDVRTTLSRLLRNPGAWRNSLLRSALPERLRSEMDGLARAELKETLATMNELSERYGFDSALTAMEEAAESGRFSSATSMVLAARLSTFEPEGVPSVDLRVYDAMLEPVGGVRS
jgi:hypothetical protein